MRSFSDAFSFHAGICCVCSGLPPPVTTGTGADKSGFFYDAGDGAALKYHSDRAAAVLAAEDSVKALQAFEAAGGPKGSPKGGAVEMAEKKVGVSFSGEIKPAPGQKI